LKTLARLTALSDAAWAMAARAREKGNDKLEADALRLAKDTAKEITDIVTDNKPLIDAAYEAAVDGQEYFFTQLLSIRCLLGTYLAHL
jgi:hypothetical protein